jgi:DHA2 family multidrug resistance protein
MFLSAPVAGRVTRWMDPRIAMFFGFSVAAWAIGLGTRVTDQWGFSEFLVLQVARGLGTMVAMIASQQMSISTLPVTMMKDASGLINLIRNVAGAIGLAMLTTILSHQGAVHYADLATALSTANPTGQDMMTGLTGLMSESGMADPEGGARKAYSMLLHRQAAVLSFGDAFGFLSLGCWAAVVMALFVRPGKAPPLGAGGGH